MTEQAKWSSSLVRTRISDFLIDELRQTQVIETSAVDGLTSEFLNKKDIQNQLKIVKSWKKLLEEDLYDSLMEELSEMKEDFTWAKSRRGKYVMEINDWIQGFHSEFNHRFEKLLVGAHSELEVVYVSGKASEEEAQSAVAFLESKNPPRKILLKLV